MSFEVTVTPTVYDVEVDVNPSVQPFDVEVTVGNVPDLELTTNGDSGASTFDPLTGELNIPNYTLDGLGGVPESRTITINGTTQDLSANRTFSIPTHDAVTIGSPANGLAIDGNQILTIGLASSGANGALSSTDWSTFNNKQNAIGYTPENVANKAINFTSPDDTKYPTTLAVSTALAGKQDLLTNPITGTGTSGQVSFWTGVNTVGGSNLFFYQEFAQGVNIQVGYITSVIPSTSYSSYVFGGTNLQPHTIGTGAYLAGIWGGYDCIINNNSFASHIVGSQHSQLSGTHNAIVGGSYGLILNNTTNYSIIAGGQSNEIAGSYSVVIGGSTNKTGINQRSTIIGSRNNECYAIGAGIFSSDQSIVDAGSTNSVIVGGATNVIDDSGVTYSSINASIFGGASNTITNADYGSIIGAFQSTVSRRFAIVAGGRANQANGEYSFVAGRRSIGNNAGTFTIGDSTDADNINNITNSFRSRFSGGYRLTGGNVSIGDITATTTLDVNGTGRIRNGVSLADVSGNVQIGSVTDAGFRLDVNGTARVQGDLTISDTRNIILATGTGTKIGTATSQKLALWNATPIVQPTTAVAGATRVGGGGTNLTDTDTFDGYTLAQIVKALRNMGALA